MTSIQDFPTALDRETEAPAGHQIPAGREKPVKCASGASGASGDEPLTRPRTPSRA